MYIAGQYFLKQKFQIFDNAAFEDYLELEHSKMITVCTIYVVYYQYLTAVCAHSLLVRILSFSSLSGIWLELKRKLFSYVSFQVKEI